MFLKDAEKTTVMAALQQKRGTRRMLEDHISVQNATPCLEVEKIDVSEDVGKAA